MSDCEIARFYTAHEPVARKQHDCVECDAKILVGEKYLVVSGMWEGVISRERQHLLCARACELVRDTGMNNDECLAFGELFIWWDNWISDDIKCHSEYKKLRQMLYRIRRRERDERRNA